MGAKITVAQLWRYPVKAHGAEALKRVTLAAGQTVPWDRVWAVAHEAAEIAKGPDGAEWASCRNFARGAGSPALMAIKSKLDEATGQLTLTHPDLETITLSPDADGARLVEWATPLVPDGRAQPAEVIRAAGAGMTDTDFASISVLGLSSLRALSQKAGLTLDPLRFRGNIWLDGTGPWEEFEWVGRTLKVGSAELRIEERITRCMATTANPATGKRDAATLDALQDGWDHRDFGVYGVVTCGGDVSIGDTLEVI